MAYFVTEFILKIVSATILECTNIKRDLKLLTIRLKAMHGEVYVQRMDDIEMRVIQCIV